MKKKALIVLADGFEEIETITPIDILRRAGIEVIVAGLNKEEAIGSRGVIIKTKIKLSAYSSMPDAVVLPGGSPGAENLARSGRLKELILNMNSKEKLICAICASPALVLAPIGILDGKKATCYPGMEKNFSVDVRFSNDSVIQDGNIITSRGPATALPFALKIVESLARKDLADIVAKQVLFNV